MTTISLFKFSNTASRLWAFTQMGLAPRSIGEVPGLSFLKFLGSGGTNGFGFEPNFSVYAILGVWETEANFREFWETHPVALRYKKMAEVHQTAFLHTSMVHGQWDGACPFETEVAFDVTQPVAVLTRATIRRRHLMRFWKQVAPVSKDIEERPGLRFAIGVGELPWIQQATFSIWESGKQMLDYAYKREKHAEVIRRTRELGWYKEELFARFVPYHTEGSGFF
jgi:hypothetical protein